MNRRTFLAAAAGIATGDALAQAPPFPIIDTHIHLFDPTRPQGVPWPTKDNAYVNGAFWHLTFQLILNELQPA